MNEHEAQRIAAAMHELRPDWPASSILTLIRKNLADKPRRDVVVALGWIACETNTATPARVLEAGPWWRAAGVEGTSTGGRRDWPDDAHRCRTCSLDRPGHDRLNANTPAGEDHPFEPALTPDEVDAARATAALREIKATERPPSPPKPETTTDGTERVAPVRAALAEKREETDA